MLKVEGSVRLCFNEFAWLIQREGVSAPSAIGLMAKIGRVGEPSRSKLPAMGRILLLLLSRKILDL